MLNLTNYFDLERLGFTLLMGFGGAAIAMSIVGLLTRSGQYMVYAVLIWGLCAFLPIVQYFVLSVPNTIGAIVNGLGLNAIVISTSVDPVTGVVTEVTAASALLVTFGLWVGVWGALYAFGLIFQRDMNV
jgi:FtsH-binding integral membrane protein